MFDYEARHIIEALRSGIPSRSVGLYFSEARTKVVQELKDDLDKVARLGIAKGRIISGKYGEGKTHLLNTVFNLAHSKNMVVSTVTLSKETPLDKTYLLYQKVMQNTYLPKREQPGIGEILEQLIPDSNLTNDLLLFSAKQLETDKLYHVLRSYLYSDDQDERFLLRGDIEGDFISNTQVKQLYRRIFQEKVQFNTNFNKFKNSQDYFAFWSRIFRMLGYNGWVILFDETELIGRLGKKTRMKAYHNLGQFLFPHKQFEALYSLFAISSSFAEDVIEAKKEYENLEQLQLETIEAEVKRVLDTIIATKQLNPLSKNEIEEVIQKLIYFHGRAYNWEPKLTVSEIQKEADAFGYLLRTKIRLALECLDQAYQYGSIGKSSLQSLTDESFVQELQELLQEEES
ncbi:MAG: BREX system ATP-binding domain-containing protein [Sphaerochaetaceae bacterium]